MNLIKVFTIFACCSFTFGLNAQQNDVVFDSIYVFQIDTVHTKDIEVKAEVKETEYTHTVMIGSSEPFMFPPCPYTVENALKDIENEEIELVICGAFVGFPKEDAKKSEAFRKKYNVNFGYVDCMPYYDRTGEDIGGYNKLMKEYLKKKYGQQCLNEFAEIFK